MLPNIHRSHNNNFLDKVIQLHRNYVLDNLQCLEINQVTQVWQCSCKGVLIQVSALHAVIRPHISKEYGKPVVIQLVTFSHIAEIRSRLLMLLGMAPVRP